MIKFSDLLDTKDTAGVCIIHARQNVLLVEKHSGEWEVPKGHKAVDRKTFVHFTEKCYLLNRFSENSSFRRRISEGFRGIFRKVSSLFRAPK